MKGILCMALPSMVVSDEYKSMKLQVMVQYLLYYEIKINPNLMIKLW